MVDKWGQQFNLHLTYLSLILVLLSFSNGTNRQHGQPGTWELEDTPAEGTFPVVATRLHARTCLFGDLASFIGLGTPLQLRKQKIREIYLLQVR